MDCCKVDKLVNSVIGVRKPQQEIMHLAQLNNLVDVHYHAIARTFYFL